MLQCMLYDVLVVVHLGAAVIRSLQAHACCRCCWSQSLPTYLWR
jgi:hypothetical protein